jgi:hypothetical protein
MKKIILYRLVVMAALCMTTLLIKSENSICNATCAYMPGKTAAANAASLNDDVKKVDNEYGSLFIKI